MPPLALALAIKRVCQQSRGVEMTKQKWYNEFWFFNARSLLDEVKAAHADFPLAQLAHAAQVKSDWEGYLWHWALRTMLAQGTNTDLQDCSEQIAKARSALAMINAISRYGILMEKVDATALGRVLTPTLTHTLNAVQLAFGNPNFDPSTVERDETKRSRLMVEMFDNYLRWGQNWRWQRSRSWAYLARVSENLPTYTCDTCGVKMVRSGQMWRCPRCGKTPRPAVPGTHEVVEPFVCGKCGYRDEYRASALECPACKAKHGGSYKLNRGWNSPTFARLQQGMKNAEHVHHLCSLVFKTDSVLPTRADREAFAAWLKTSPSPERVPALHEMELETHEARLAASAGKY
jgi:hypothetical protein